MIRLSGGSKVGRLRSFVFNSKMAEETEASATVTPKNALEEITNQVHCWRKIYAYCNIYNKQGL